MLNTKDQKLIGDLSIYSEPHSVEEAIVTPSKGAQEIVAQEADCLSKVIVNPIPDDYVQVSGSVTFTTNGVFDVKTKEECIVSFPQYWGDYSEIEGD